MIPQISACDPDVCSCVHAAHGAVDASHPHQPLLSLLQIACIETALFQAGSEHGGTVNDRHHISHYAPPGQMAAALKHEY